MGNAAKRDTRTAETQEKRHKALELRKRGLTYRQISQALSCSVSVAHDYVETAIAAIPLESAEDVRRLELERVDRMIAGVWPAASAGDPKAILAACKLMERRAKYLGIDAPNKVEVAGKDGGPIESRSMQDDLIARLSRIYEQNNPQHDANGHSNGVGAAEPGASGTGNSKPNGSRG